MWWNGKAIEKRGGGLQGYDSAPPERWKGRTVVIETDDWLGRSDAHILAV